MGNSIERVDASATKGHELPFYRDLSAELKGRIIAWYIAASFGPADGQIDYSSPAHEIRDRDGVLWYVVTSSSQSPFPNAIFFTDDETDLINIQSATYLPGVGHSFSLSISTLIAALRLISSEIESALYLPAEYRNPRIEKISQELGLSKYHLGRLAFWKSAILD